MKKVPESITCKYTFSAMGGHFYLKCFPQSFISRNEIQCIFKQAEKEVKRIETKFTEFHDSPFNKINDNAGIKPVIVDHEIFSLIKKAQSISAKSKGIFDITTSSFLRPWRLAQKEKRELKQQEIDYFKSFIDFKKIQLNEKEQSIFLPYEDMRIGLGGIGKGYAVDQIFNLLQKAGIYNFYINGSGDIRVHSHHKAPRKWRVGIRNPLSRDPSKSVGLIQVSNHAVATSGGYVQYNKLTKNKNDHHIISKHENNDRIISATVIAETSIESDTQATILMNMNLDDGLDYSKNENLASILITQNGNVRVSDKAYSLLSI